MYNVRKLDSPLSKLFAYIANNIEAMTSLTGNFNHFSTITGRFFEGITVQTVFSE